MTLGEFFEQEKIDRDFVWDRFDDEPYWANCKNFVEKNWDKPLSDLSEKQVSWAHKILEDCVEKRIEG